MKSFIYGRIGSIDQTTGLFVLDAKSTPEMDETIAAVALTKSGVEFNSTQAYTMNGSGVQHSFTFLNQSSRCSKHLADFYPDVEKHRVRPAEPQQTYWEIEKTKLGPKVFCDKLIGLAPRGRLLKVILREKDVGTKRVIVFGLGYRPQEGGRTWVVSPHGFPWYTTTRNIIDEFDGNLAPYTSKDNALFLVVTGAVPLITGPIQRQRDEEHPRILWGHEEPYDTIMRPMEPLFEDMRKLLHDDKPHSQYIKHKKLHNTKLWTRAARLVEKLGVPTNIPPVIMPAAPSLSDNVIDLSDLDIML